MRVPVPGGVTLALDLSNLGTLSRFPPEMDRIFTLYGRVLLEWTCAEQELDTLIQQTHSNAFVAGIEDHHDLLAISWNYSSLFRQVQQGQ